MSQQTENGVVWSKSLRRKLHPWPGLEGIKPPKPNLKTVLKRLHEVRRIAGKLKPSGEFRTAIQQALPRLDSLHLAPATPDPETEAISAVLLGCLDPFWPRADEIGADLVHLWAEQGGTQLALEATMALWRYQGADGRVQASLLTNCPVDYPKPFTVLRSYLASQGPAESRHSLELAQPHWEQAGLAIRCQLAYLFPDQSEWVNQALEQWSDPGTNPADQRAGYRLAGSLENCQQTEILIQTAIDRMGHRELSAYLPTLAARVGIDAGPSLLRLLAGCPDAASKRACVLALAAVPSEQTLFELVPWLDDKTVRGMVTEALTQAPDSAVPALSKRKALGGPGSKAGSQILQTLVAIQPGMTGSEEIDTLELPILELLPNKAKALPTWLRPAALPPLQLTNGQNFPSHALPRLVALLSLKHPSPELAQLAQACQATSLEEFAWALFTAWELAGADTKQIWALRTLGHFGSDETARRLTPLIRRWPKEGFSKRAAVGLDVLAAIGTELSLMHLNGIAQKVRYKALQKKAREKMQEIADRLELSPEELADRLVPALDLAPDGTRKLDFGSRYFKVGFDEQLRPYVEGPDGKQRKSLPKPGKTDDPELASQANQIWKSLKRDVKAIARTQLRRLECALVRRRRWEQTVFRQLLVEHPLLVHLVQRLVWGFYDGQGELQQTFRVAEDSTYTSLEDQSVTREGLVGIVHPFEMEPQLERWSSLFADYQLLQPFPQLNRPSHRAETHELKAKVLTRWSGSRLPSGRVLGLENLGWERGETDSGCLVSMHFPLRAGGVADLELDPGVYLPSPNVSPEQVLGRVRLTSVLDPVEFSEIALALGTD